jgi:hypothetical protein
MQDVVNISIARLAFNARGFRSRDILFALRDT